MLHTKKEPGQYMKPGHGQEVCQTGGTRRGINCDKSPSRASWENGSGSGQLDLSVQKQRFPRILVVHLLFVFPC